MADPQSPPRRAEAHIDCMFTDRWSPRALIDEPLPAHQIQSLFEAARWAPSCFNEQPWEFVYAVTERARGILSTVLAEKNRIWASSAPLLLFALARRTFARNGRENRHASFDAGAAWMSLALQARKLGLYAHAMAGFDLDRAYEVLRVSKRDYLILAAVAVGRRADPGKLPQDMQAAETPSSRKAPSEVAREFSVP